MRERIKDAVKEDIRKKHLRYRAVAKMINPDPGLYNVNHNVDDCIFRDGIRDSIRLRRAIQLARASLYLPGIESDYRISINDSSIDNPFCLNSDIVQTIKTVTVDISNEQDKSRKLFDWFEDNIAYGDSKRMTGYSNGIEVFLNEQGVCGEMSFLYVTMARTIGMKSNYVSVKKDYRGDDVHHACAGVNLGHRMLLVDPAYHTFDIKHKDFKVRTDLEIMELYNQWRKN